MELSDRLLSVAKLVLPAKTLADVGCDHGYLSVYLINEKKCEHVIAMDVRKGPLARAEQTIRTYGMEPYIELRLSDGLNKLGFGEADGYVCAGMGGRLALQIMWQDRFKVAAMKQVILQPQSELWLVRRMLKKWGCVIDEERMVCDEGKFYPMMRMIPGEGFAEAKEVEEGSFLDCFTEDNWEEYAKELYGELLLAQNNPVLEEFLIKEATRLSQIGNTLSDLDESVKLSNRKKELKTEQMIAVKTLETFYGKRFVLG